MKAVPENAQYALNYARKMLWMGQQLTRNFAENVPLLWFDCTTEFVSWRKYGNAIF